VRRRLAAILAADVVDFSRRMGQDEVNTLAAVKHLFGALLIPCVAARGGRVFKTMGDGALAIFDSAVEAVAAAHEVQEAVRKEKVLELRIAVHAGDVLIDDEDDTFGDGVNIASRLQGLGKPGEILISGEVLRAVRRKLPFRFESRGTPHLKNIAEPVEVFVLLDGLEGEAPASRRGNLAHGETRASIIVLPFANLSHDSEQEYFCDGLTQDITTDLSKFADLFVFAANSAFTFKGRAVRPSELSRDLGVRYLLEGSVQKAGNKIRLNAQLIEAPTERHLWAERLDRGIDDLLEVQDELVRRIVSVLAIRVTASEMERVGRKETEDINAYDAFLRGAHAYLTQVDKSAESETGLEEAERWFRRATEIDPAYARAWGWLGYSRMNRVLEGWAPAEAAAEAEDHARRAVALSPDDHDTHWALGFVYSATGRPQRGLTEFEEARRINPNDANMLAEMAEVLTQLGRHEEAVAQVRQAFKLNPYAPEWYRWMLGWALHHARDYAGAIAELERILAPNNEVRLILAASHARMAESEEHAERRAHHRRLAESYCSEFLSRRPDWTVERERATIHFEQGADREHWIAGLMLAGMS
jgi:TolB-like protein/Flp pilus assembly protein TadD